MSMRSKSTMMALMQLAIVSDIMSDNNKKLRDYVSEEDRRIQERKLEINRKNLLLKKGVKQFTIDGFTVMARDEKNAIRKVERLKAQNKLIV